METETNKSQVERGLGFDKRSHHTTPSERCSKSCTGGDKPIHFNTVYSETSIQEQANFQFEESQSLCPISEVQDGRSGSSTQTDSTRRLHDEVRSPRRLFFHTDSQQSQEISEVCFPRNNVRVPMPAIRAIQCTQDIYKTIETGHGIATTTRNTDCNISGRYAYSGPKPRKTVVNFSECCQSTTTSGIYHQTGEMLPSPIPVSRVPGILDQLEGDDTSCTQRQTPKAPNRVQECTPKLLADTERTLGLIRQDEPLLPSGSSPGPFALSCSAEATYQQHSPEQTSLEQDEGLFDKRITNRPPMVDFDADTSVQQVFNLSTGVRPGHLHRRIQSRMGSTVQRHVSHDRGTMEHPRIQTTHQHSRNESSPPGHPVFSEDTGKNATTHCSADGQLYSSCICQQERGNQVFDFSSLGDRSLERLSKEGNMDNSTTPSGSTERRCGLGFSSLQRTHRVDSGQGDLHTYSHKV